MKPIQANFHSGSRTPPNPGYDIKEKILKLPTFLLILSCTPITIFYLDKLSAAAAPLRLGMV